MHILFILLPYNLLFIFMGMRAPDWAMNNIRTLEKKKYMWLDIVGYSRKSPNPPDGSHGFLTLPYT